MTGPIDRPSEQDPKLRRAGAYLTVDLSAIQQNFQLLKARFQGETCAAVVKANAYGLGAAPVAKALAAAGARQFFVAQIGEAVTLREALSEHYPDTRIYDFGGVMPGAEVDYLSHEIRPVLNSLGDIERWRTAARRQGRALPAALHYDSGMSRLGLPDRELELVSTDPSEIEGIDLDFIMSHLSCTEDPEHPANPEQLHRFQVARKRFPHIPASLANSAAIYLGPEYHFDIARPGIALYGGAPFTDQSHDLNPVVQLAARILQVREIDAQEGVGYGAAFRAPGPIRVATTAVGYADGYLRALSNQGVGFIDGKPVPLVGRVSMDYLTFDVSALPDASVQPGTMVELLGANQGIDALAKSAGTIGHEVLTNLGRRYHRNYLGA